MRARPFLLLLSAGLLLARPAPAAPVVGKPAPAFTLADVDGKPRRLAEFRGRPVALFFFCGCEWCGDVAKEWAALQRSGALPKPAATVVVYAEMDAPVAREVATIYGLDRSRTVLLPDPERTATVPLYQAEPCPRVFVLDGGGVLRYTNDHADDAPRKAPALAITSRTLQALRAATPAVKPKAKPSSRSSAGRAPAR